MLRVDHLNVGHGDMSLVELPDGAFLLVDVNVSAGSESLEFLKDRIPADANGHRVIDILVVTHPDADHITGLDVLEDEGFSVEQVWESKYRFDDDVDRPEYERFLELVEKVGSTKLLPGRQPRQCHGVDLYTFCSCGDSANNGVHYNGLVFKIAYAGRAVLFAGDSDLASWRDKVVPNYGPGDGDADDVSNLLASNYLHASHHGSRTFFVSSKDDEPYVRGLELVNPDLTVISSLSREDSEDAGGENQDWPPHDDAVALYEQYSSEVVITGEDGTVTYQVTDAGEISRAFSAQNVSVRMGRKTRRPSWVAKAPAVVIPQSGPKPWAPTR